MLLCFRRKFSVILTRLDLFHGGEEDNFFDGIIVCQEHYQPVNTYTDPTGRGQAIANGIDEIVINHLCLHIAQPPLLILFLEPGLLVDRVVQLRETVAHFHTADEELKSLSETFLGAVTFRERRILDRVIVDECRLDQLLFNKSFKECYKELPMSPWFFPVLEPGTVVRAS